MLFRSIELNLSWTAHTGTGNMRLYGIPFVPSESVVVPVGEVSPYNSAGTVPKLLITIGDSIGIPILLSTTNGSYVGDVQLGNTGNINIRFDIFNV